MNFKNQFALYRGVQFLYVGSIPELAKFCNCQEKSIRYMSYPSYHRRIEKRE